MRNPLIAVAFVALSACSPSIPDSGAGVGFGDYDQYLKEKAARDAQLQGSAVPPAGAVSDEGLDDSEPAGQIVAEAQTQTQTQTDSQPATRAQSDDIAADTQALLAETQSNSGETVVNASPSNPAPQAVLNPGGISNENDFEAVGAQRSIESDAARIAANKQQYRVIEAQALPSRTGTAGPNIVGYALRSDHAVGTKLYNRIGIGLSAKAARNCGKYASPDLAQTAFLEKGGPERDRMGLDPDGDGYACGWDPAPFRKAVSG